MHAPGFMIARASLAEIESSAPVWTLNQRRLACFARRLENQKKWFPRQCCVVPAFLCSEVLSLAHWGKSKHHSFSMFNYSCCLGGSRA